MPLKPEFISELRSAGKDVWALSDHGLEVLASKFLAREAGVKATKAIGALPRVAGTVAVLPLYGVISNSSNDWWADTSTDYFGAIFQAAMKSELIKAVVINIDSPGGSVYGVQELGAKMFDARGSKPFAGIANCCAASAAYWLGSQCEQFSVMPSGDVGCVGVYSMHQDYSKMMDEAGVKTTFVKAGKYKTEGNPYEPLDTDALQSMQARVDGFYADFVGAVAKGRGKSAATVKSDFGEGRLVRSKDALAAGMIDRVATLDKLLGELGVGSRSDSRARAEDDEATAVLCELAGVPYTGSELAVQGCGDPEILRLQRQLKERGA